MAHARLHELARDEAGGGTMMGLFWFMLLVGMTGLAVDITDGLRNRTMLQATADASALAAAIDLPDKTVATDTAVAYASGNMSTSGHGTVLDPADVHVGKWDPDTLSLDRNAIDPDAVMVTVWRGAANDNPLPVNFLRIVGLGAWNVRAQAVAQRYIPDCLKDGLIASDMVYISSNNSFVNQICVHGQQGVKVQSNNYFEPGVNVSMYDLETLQVPSSGFESNTGLRDALREQGLQPRDVNHVDEIMQKFLDLDPSVMPSYINPDGNPNFQVITVDEKFDLGAAQPGNVYYVDCKPNKNAQIPANSVIQRVVIIADCEVQIGSGAMVFNAVIGSRSGGNGSVTKANVGIPAGAQLGLPDNCAAGGGVILLSNATIKTSAQTRIDGVQMIAAGDIELGAMDYGINGISAQAGGDITMTSNNQFGLCQGGAPGLFVTWYYRLVL